MNWLSYVSSLWRDNLLNMDKVGRALVQPQVNVPGFAYSPSEAQPLSEEWMWNGVGGRWGR